MCVHIHVYMHIYAYTHIETGRNTLMHLCMCRELWKAIVDCFIVAISKKVSGTRKRSGTRVEKIVSSLPCLSYC